MRDRAACAAVPTRWTKELGPSLALLLLLSGNARAQSLLHNPPVEVASEDREHDGLPMSAQDAAGGATHEQDRSIGGYAYLAPGLFTSRNHLDRAFHIGGGVAWRLAGPVAVVAEAGVGGVGEEAAFGLLAANVAYYFRDTPRRETHVVPFATAGYAAWWDGYSWRPLFNLGAGLNYWWNRHEALRIEIRDHVGSDRGVFSLLDFRVGISFGR
jgi:hypothetical protein